MGVDAVVGSVAACWAPGVARLNRSRSIDRDQTSRRQFGVLPLPLKPNRPLATNPQPSLSPHPHTQQVINPSDSTISGLNIVYNVPRGAQIPPGGTAWYDGVVVTSTSPPATSIGANGEGVQGKVVTYTNLSVGPKKVLKLTATFLA